MCPCTSALEQRLRVCLLGSDSPAPILGFKATRMLATGVDNSAKLSAYHALGCISPRQVHAALGPLIEAGGAAAEGAGCLHMHLIIRSETLHIAIDSVTPCDMPAIQ